ncbi:MAG TPA: glycosyltransferase family 39 protein, partial [Armatimonadota bacterium]|nr:glycosyltransferase family 39 protein [Armatimonadota bacterium]
MAVCKSELAEERRFRREAAALFGAGGLLRLAMLRLLPMPPYPALEEQYYSTTAHSLAFRGTFTEHYLHAFRPPGYPAFLALHLRLFGEATRPVQVSQNLLFLLAAALFTLLARRLAGPRVALITAALLLLNPLWLVLPQEAYSETLFITLAAGALLAAAPLLDRQAPRRSDAGWALLVGLLFGLGALVREIGALMALVVLGVVLLQFRKQGDARRAARVSAAVLLGLLVTIGPWTLRNYRLFHRLVPVTTNGAVNLYLGNNPQATGGYVWILPPEVAATWNRAPDPHGERELAAARRCGAAALAYMAAHPLRTVELSFTKLARLWSAGPLRPLSPSAAAAMRLYRWLFW